LISNHFPWLVLSQLATLGIFASGDDATPHFQLLETLGSCPFLLRRIDVAPASTARPFHFHDFPGLGSVACPEIGIVEPLTVALQRTISLAPEAATTFSLQARDAGNFLLSWRLYLASLGLRQSSESIVAEAARKIMSTALEIVNDALKALHSVPGDPERTASGGKRLSSRTQGIIAAAVAKMFLKDNS
jgi:hypothetical protein